MSEAKSKAGLKPTDDTEKTGIAGWSRRHAVGVYRLEKVLLVGSVALTLYVLVAGTMNVWNVTVNQCDQIQNGSPRGWILAGAALLGAGIGRIFARVRYEARLKLNGRSTSGASDPAWVHVGVFVFLVLATALLVYETWAEVNFGHPPPITSYVRCAAYYNALWATITAFGTGFLLSNWLWYPTR